MSARPAPAPAASRLAAALAASLTLHLLLLAGLGEVRRAGGDAGRPTLQLRLVAVPVAPPPAAAVPPDPAAVAPAAAPPAATTTPAPGAEADGPPLSEAPRLAAPPDFGALEEIALTGPLRLRLRIHVNPLGRAGAIEVLETRLVPSDFLAGITARLRDARYLPGRADGIAVDSSFELVIEAAPSVEFGSGTEGARRP